MTKTQLKNKVDAIFAEIDVHTDLTPAQRAAYRREVAALLANALEVVHNAVPAVSKKFRKTAK
jgi:hypothetical protein